MISEERLKVYKDQSDHQDCWHCDRILELIAEIRLLQTENQSLRDNNKTFHTALYELKQANKEHYNKWSAEVFDDLKAEGFGFEE